MNQVAEKLNIKKVLVSTMPIVTLEKSKKEKNVFELVSCKANKDDSKKNEIVKALGKFVTTYPSVPAKKEKLAYDMYSAFLNTFFETEKQVKQAETKTDDKKEEKQKATRKGKTKTDNKKADNKKAEAKTEEKKEEKQAEKKEKVLAKFTHFCETSSVKCLPLSKENKKVVAEALQVFELNNKTLNNALTDQESNILNSEASVKKVDKLLNRNSIRLLIVEVNKDNKVVAQYLLKLLYMSPYSFLSVCEGHNRDKKVKKLAYEYIINSIDSKLTCYDSLQFNPLLETLTTSEIEKTDHTLKYDFVNIVVE